LGAVEVNDDVVLGSSSGRLSLNWKQLQRRVRTAKELAGEDPVPPRLDATLRWCRDCDEYVKWATFKEHVLKHRAAKQPPKPTRG
jgi:hypothetical protein